MPAPTPDAEPADDAQPASRPPPAAPPLARRTRLSVRRRRALPWSERSILFASLLMLAVSAPLWIDPLTLGQLLGIASGGPVASATPLEPARPAGATAGPTAATSVVIAADTFSRRLSAGWGNAEEGGSYRLAGRVHRLAVEPGVGVVGLAAGDEGHLVLPVTARDVSVDFAVAIERPPSAGEIELQVVLRRTPAGAAYVASVRVAADGTLSVGAAMDDGVSGRPLGSRFAVPGMAADDATVLRIRGEAVGSDPTTLRLRVWPATAAQPSYWHLSVIDWSGALQGPGAAAIGWHAVDGAAPLTLRYDDLLITTGDAGHR